MDPTYPLIPVANVIASTLVLVPLILLFRTWQISISVYAMWICVKGLTTAVRAVVWNDNTRIVVPLFCDIGMSTLILSSTNYSNILFSYTP